MNTKGTFILSIDKKEIEITDFKEAYAQTKEFVTWHEQAKKDNDPENGIYYFKDAHEHWAHILKELDKLACRFPELKN